MGPFGKFYPSEAFFHSYDMVGEEKTLMIMMMMMIKHSAFFSQGIIFKYLC